MTVISILFHTKLDVLGVILSYQMAILRVLPPEPGSLSDNTCRSVASGPTYPAHPGTQNHS